MPHRHRTESSSSPRRLATLEKQRKALDLRLAGADFTQIAKALGYANRSCAYAAVHAAMAKVVQPGVEELRQANMERINRMRLANWPAAIKGDKDAIGVELRLQEREARYLGLDTQPSDAGAQAVALATVQVVIQVGNQAIPLGEWRRQLLEAGDGHDNGHSEQNPTP